MKIQDVKTSKGITGGILILLIGLVVFATALAGSITGFSIFSNSLSTSDSITGAQTARPTVCRTDSQCLTGQFCYPPNTNGRCLNTNQAAETSCVTNRQCASNTCNKPNPALSGTCTVPNTSWQTLSQCRLFDSSYLQPIWSSLTAYSTLPTTTSSYYGTTGNRVCQEGSNRGLFSQSHCVLAIQTGYSYSTTNGYVTTIPTEH